MSPPRRTPLNKMWGEPVKKTAPKTPDWPIKPQGDLSSINPLESIQAAVAARENDELLVVVEDNSETSDVFAEELGAKPKVRQAVYAKRKNFRVAKLMGATTAVIPTVSIHNHSPDW